MHCRKFSTNLLLDCSNPYDIIQIIGINIQKQGTEVVVARTSAAERISKNLYL